MKAAHFFTDAAHEMTPHAVFDSLAMPAASTLTVGSPIADKTFDGFGVALTGASCYNLAQMPEKERREFLESVYGKDGLGLRVARLCIGSSDYAAELYSYDDVPGDITLSHFSIERDKAYILPMLREVLSVCPDLKLFASPWSPPGWMKTGGLMCGGYMRREFIDVYADYIVKFIEAYEKEGVRISALTAQNEPETQQSGRMPACIWHPDIEAEFIVRLRQKLDAAGYKDIRVWMHDHNFDGWRRVKGSLDDHPELRKACGDVAFHYYTGAVEDILPLQKAYPDMNFHMTEGGPFLGGTFASDFCKWGVLAARCVGQGFLSFTGWNLLLDETGGPNVGPFDCGGLVQRHAVTGELSYSGQYKAFRHITPFLKDGARALSTSFCSQRKPRLVPTDDHQPIDACAFENPDGSVVALVTNPSLKKRQMTVDIKDERFYVELLPGSVNTLLFK